MATNVTRKELVNKVLRRLREDELTASQAIADVPYAAMVGEFFNDVKEEVEDAWNWSQLRAELDFNTTSGNSLYNLGDADVTSTALTVIDSDGNIFYVSSVEGYNTEDASNERTQILGIFNNTQKIELHNKSDRYFNRVTKLGTQQNSLPDSYRTKGYDNNGDMIVELYPVPDATYAMTCWVYNPQEPLITDASVLVLSCAETAIIHGTWAKCISERGEDGGQLFDEVTKKYNDYLATAIARDRAHYDSSDDGAEGDWVVV
jgi:hypothetical protein